MKLIVLSESKYTGGEKHPIAIMKKEVNTILDETASFAEFHGKDDMFFSSESELENKLQNE